MSVERRYSRKREAIREELMRSKDHPSAEMLFSRLRPLYPDLSLGTVYRNLTSFREAGDIFCAATVDGTERFDADLRPHAHFVCEQCGCVLDVEEPLPPQYVHRSLPGTVKSYSLTYYGICDRCL